jgi:hypothetical protein
MRPGLSLPEIGANDVILSDRVDDHIRMIASHVNGGLTGESLAPGTKLAASRFSEQNSVYVMSNGAAGTNTSLVAGITAPSNPSRLVSFSAIFQNLPSATSSPQAPVQFTIQSAGVNVYLSPSASPYQTPLPKTPLVNGATSVFVNGNVSTALFYFPLEMNVTIAASTILSVLSTSTSSWSYKYFFLVLSTIHTS